MSEDWTIAFTEEELKGMDLDTPVDDLGSALTLARSWLCKAGEPWVGSDAVAGSDHGHTDCWALGVLIRHVEMWREIFNGRWVKDGPHDRWQPGIMEQNERLRALIPEVIEQLEAMGGAAALHGDTYSYEAGNAIIAKLHEAMGNDGVAGRTESS